ncbi:zeatin O-xylosyltransferase-like [Humulus lupulus]|uniref:zeatin O-xylosyltransferase-like n=1 Tax=Humulus lupulus TaxID=3486 RepID=UPI002B40E621|nr:zeatin O-xylosyltransferase-like [Humulus lupulus]XP_062117845.1 zeatin O-xylosyltransferase-like [Humulus lupulus]
MATSQDQLSSVIVLMVPFPAQSHLNQLLQLSHVVSSYNIPVHYVSSALHNSQIKSRAPNPLHHLAKIHFHDFPTPHFVSPQPTKTADNFPIHLVPAFEASVHLRQPFSDLLTRLSTTAERVVIIHDFLMSYVVQDSDSLAPNSETYVFHCVSAISRVSFIRDAAGGGLGTDHESQLKIPSWTRSFDPRFDALLAKQIPFMRANKSAHLYNACRLIESEFLDFIYEKELESDDNMKLWAVGPLDTVTICKKSPLNNSINGDSEQVYYLEWLERQKPNSVLYISFGTTTFLEDRQIEEIAIGLEKSEVNFFWVLRDADRGDIFGDEQKVGGPQLPKGFEERVEGKGMVVREWVPQLEILGHPSTGGFMSHCGWNSCMESMSLGVPLIAWPMHSDQPMNAAFVTEFVKVGLAVGELGNRDELVNSSTIEKVVKKLMSFDEGNEIRKRAKELGDELRKATAEGGVSRMEMDSLISHITR